MSSNNKNNNNNNINDKANQSTASLIEEERVIAKLTIKTLSDRTIKLDYTDATLTLSQLKDQLKENHIDLTPEQQFFLLAGQVYGRDGASDSLRIADLPGFKDPECIVKEFLLYEEKRKRDSESESIDENNNNSSITIVKGIEELLPTLYIFHYEPAAKALDPLDSVTDWDQKNRLKFFKGLWAVAERDLEASAIFLVEALPTFEENGCLPYGDLVKYAVITASVTFDRPLLKSKVLQYNNLNIKSLFINILLYYQYLIVIFIRLLDHQKF